MQRSSRFGSYSVNFPAIDIIYQLSRFRQGFILANTTNLLTHYTKGTLLQPALLLVALIASMIANSGSISPVIDLLFTFPSRYFSLSLNTYTQPQKMVLLYFKQNFLHFTLYLLVVIYRAITFYGLLFPKYSITFTQVNQASPVSLATTSGVSVDFLSYSYLDVSVHCVIYIWFPNRIAIVTIISTYIIVQELQLLVFPPPFNMYLLGILNNHFDYLHLNFHIICDTFSREYFFFETIYGVFFSLLLLFGFLVFFALLFYVSLVLWPCRTKNQRIFFECALSPFGR